MLYLRHRTWHFNDGGIDIRRADRMLRDLSARVGQAELRTLTKKRALDLGEMGKDNRMKKYLVGAAAAAAAAGVALAMPATAQDEMDDMMPSLTMSGSMNNDFGFGSYVGQEQSADDFHLDIGATITFAATGTTDGGLTVSAAMALDADSGGIGESHLTVAGGFGAINIGSNDNAANMHGNGGTGKGYGGGGYYSGGNFTPALGGRKVPNSDSLGIRYSTPSIGGFQAGISFQPEDGADGAATTVANDSNVIAVGANFSGDFAGTSLTLSAGHVSQKTTGDGDTLKSWGLGASTGIGDTTLSIRYDRRSEQVASAVMGAMMGDETSFAIGVDHNIGNLTFGIGMGTRTEENAAIDDYAFAWTDEVEGVNTIVDGHVEAMPDMGAVMATSGQDRKHTTISAGAEYVLGGGVTVSAGIHHGKMTNSLTGGAVSFCISEVDQMDGVGELANRPDAETENGTPINTLGVLSCGDDEALVTSNTLEDLDDVGVGLRIAFSF